MSIFRNTAVSQVRPMPKDSRKCVESYIHVATCKAAR